MKNLLLMRHAATADKTMGQTDVDRELTLLGERQAGEAGLWLMSQNLVPELVLCSTAVRTQQTAQLLLSNLSPSVPVHRERSLYDQPEGEIIHLIQGMDEEVDTLLVIGHNPTIGMLASQLCHSTLSFQEATVVALQFPGFDWSGVRAGTCKLHLLYRA